jgi:DNA ligase-1
MKRFAELYRRLDDATATSRKQAALVDYFRGASQAEESFGSAAWAAYILAGGKPRQAASTKILRALAMELGAIPEWLFEERYQNVGDLAETLTLLLPAPSRVESAPLDVWLNDRLPALRAASESDRSAMLRACLEAMSEEERFVFFKLITGGMRVGVSKQSVVNALAIVAEIEPNEMAQRMMGYAQQRIAPRPEDFAALIAPRTEGAASTAPYPFFLAHPLQTSTAALPQLLGSLDDWFAEWKFDGIRAQYLLHADGPRLWSRGEDLINESFPDLLALADNMPAGIAIDGEIVVVAPETPTSAPPISALRDIAPFAALQKRLGRKSPGAKMLREAPAVFIAYDLLEHEGRDIRGLPQVERRVALERLVTEIHNRFGLATPPLRLSPLLSEADWSRLDMRRRGARDFGAEGLMLKLRSAAYGVGRRKGGPGGAPWLKWKLDPMSIDAVLLYAQRGHGRRSGVFSDYTFGLWDEERRALVPFAKAYSGLDDEEMRQVDAIVRKTTVESFGPVRSMRPTMVFELGFEGVAASRRHKSGVAVRFPRMLRWRRDKPVAEADTLAQLREFLPGAQAHA